MELKKKFKEKTIYLKNGIKEKYFIDPDGSLARVKIDRKIYVNKDFEKLFIKEKQVIIYHERGHSKFKLWFLISQIISPMFLTASFLLLFLSLFFLFFGIALNINFFEINKIVWSFVFIVGILNFIAFLGFNYLLEIIADSNAVKEMGKKIVIKTIHKIYKNKKHNFWDDKIMHPPWKLRKKIIDELD